MSNIDKRALRKKINRRLNDAFGFRRTSGGKHTTISLSIDECKSVLVALDELEAAQHGKDELQQGFIANQEEAHEAIKYATELKEQLARAFSGREEAFREVDEIQKSLDHTHRRRAIWRVRAEVAESNLEAAEKRIAKLEALTAGMEQEPVAYMTYKGYLLHAADPKLAEYSEPMPLYAAPQLPQPAQEEIAMQNFRAAMEGIGHIRRTLEETFGGLRGTHCEPDVLVECKEICDAIYEAYRKTAQVAQDGWQLVPKEPTAAMNKAGGTQLTNMMKSTRRIEPCWKQQEVKK